MTEAYISIGANMGDRRENIASAIRLLGRKCGVIEISPVYETEPEGYPDQPLFLNCAAHIETDMGAFKLLKTLKGIEKKLGRQKSFLDAPRPIDLDILFYGEEIMREAGLEIPHPRMHLRAFVLAPLADIAPNRIHPGLHKTIVQLMDDLHAAGKVRKLEEGIADSIGS